MARYKDLKLCYQTEQKVFDILVKEYPNTKYTKEYHPYDFIADSTFFEVKSRRCRSTTYPDTMIGYNKIEYARLHPENNYVFLFDFIDGLYKHDFDPTRKYKTAEGGRTDRGYHEIKQYAYIPIEDLIQIH
jgi:hypothetical protein